MAKFPFARLNLFNLLINAAVVGTATYVWSKTEEGDLDSGARVNPVRLVIRSTLYASSVERFSRRGR